MWWIQAEVCLRGSVCYCVVCPQVTTGARQKNKAACGPTDPYVIHRSFMWGVASSIRQSSDQHAEGAGMPGKLLGGCAPSANRTYHFKFFHVARHCTILQNRLDALIPYPVFFWEGQHLKSRNQGLVVWLLTRSGGAHRGPSQLRQTSISSAMPSNFQH